MLYSHDGPEEDRSLTQDLENNNNNKTNKQTKTNKKKILTRANLTPK